MPRSARSLAALALLAVVTACVAPKRKHHSDPNALGPYSSYVQLGRTVIVSGKVGRERDTFEDETGSAIDAVEAALGDAGLSLADVVQCTVYLTDMNDYARFNAIYGERFPAPYPARACIGVAALPGGARVEIQATAVAR